MTKLVPDTSVLIERLVSKRIEAKEIQVKSILIHEAVLSELENQSNLNKEIGYIGLDEIKKLRELSKKHKFSITYTGSRPKEFEITHAKAGAIDAMIRALAYEEKATLMTADRVQALVAESKGISVLLIEFEPKKARTIMLEKFFDPATMSVHIKENQKVAAKKGRPGAWNFEEITKKALTQDEVKDIANEIVEETGINPQGFVEIERKGSTIVQLGNYRIVIAKPPLADGWEITAVRPVKTLTLDDYKLSEKLLTRIKEQAEGILIAGSPGMGKSTFASALAEFYASQNKIVKTVEAPRDLQVSEAITQYAIARGTPAEIHDILLLSRPDYTFFDEMRNTSDFKLFADMRLAGVGMIGVVHGTNPVDSIQRFIGRIEMGIIPQIIDTVVFIKNGTIAKVLSLEMTVKVPSGMTEADLARPVVVVSDFETAKPAFEIYSYGEQTVVMPVTETEKTGAFRLAEENIKRKLEKYADVEVKVVSNNNCIVYAPDENIAGIIGKQGKNIEQIEKSIGMHIDVQPLERDSGDIVKPNKKPLPFDFAFSGKSVSIFIDTKHRNKDVNIYVNDEFLMTTKSSKKAVIKIKRSKIGNVVMNALKRHDKIELFLD
ncbi:PINc/VapC family ATPase [Candidatus Woesearchaeota archaeon]|nr:PINc/VapC family ATPase [Candidatus Woesearchaeota archaeon]